MVEIVGFNEAYKKAVAVERKKEERRGEARRKINELVKQGIDRTIASAMVKACMDAGIEV